MLRIVLLLLAFTGLALSLRLPRDEPEAELDDRALSAKKPKHHSHGGHDGGHNNNHTQQVAAAEPVMPGDPAHAVMFYVAMGATSKSHFMRANVLSLRKLGEFKGPIVIVTDSMECIINNLGQELLGVQGPTFSASNLKVYAGPEPGMSIHIKNVPSTFAMARDHKPWQHHQGFEQHKALARFHTASAQLPFVADAVIIMDDDILVGHPVQSFLEEISSMEQSLATFFDSGAAQHKTDGETYHCGMVITRPGSEGCLNEWKDIVAKRFGSVDLGEWDQQRKVQRTHTGENAAEELMGIGQKAFAATSCAKRHKVKLLDNNRLGFSWPTVDTLNQGVLTTFTHFTNTYRMQNLDHQQVAEFYKGVAHLDADILEWHSHPSCPSDDGFKVFAR